MSGFSDRRVKSVPYNPCLSSCYNNLYEPIEYSIWRSYITNYSINGVTYKKGCEDLMKYVRKGVRGEVGYRDAPYVKSL